MLCPKCDTENPEDASFCRDCGEAFGDSTSPSAGAWRSLVKVCLILSIGIPLVLWFVINFCMEFEPRGPVSRAKSDMRTLATALEAYSVDNGVYPLWNTGDESLSGVEYPNILTTPVAYLTTIPDDPMALHKDATYYYYSTNTAWILWTAGKDGDYDMSHTFLQVIVKFGESEEMINLHDFCYDPTNGIVSNGDVYRVGGFGTDLIKPDW